MVLNTLPFSPKELDDQTFSRLDSYLIMHQALSLKEANCMELGFIDLQTEKVSFVCLEWK